MRQLLTTMFALVLTGAFLLSCGPSLYDIPEPPPREQWRRHSLNPADTDARSQQNFFAAQDSLLSFVEAMDQERYDDAYDLLSNETRILLDDLSPTGLGEDVLETGEIRRDETDYRVNAMDLFAIADLSDIVDEPTDGRSEAETYRRKEIYAIGADGNVHHIVLIFEENEWRIHHPDIDLTPGAPGRRSDT